MARLFISQARIDRWLAEGKVRMVGEFMSLPALGKSFRLRPAAHVRRLISGPGDIHLLVGRVKTHEQLGKLGANWGGAQLMVGEARYEFEAGFVGEVAGSAAAARPIGAITERDPPR